MGLVIYAKCHNCDLEIESLSFGAGDLDHMFGNYTRCNYPALTPDKSAIAMPDISSRSGYEKSGYIFYDSEEMYETGSKKEISNIEYYGHKIYLAKYYCPKCKKYALSFHSCGSWD